MPSPLADIPRLVLLIQRLLDAELLPDAEGAALLIESQAARQALEEGDTQAARQHVEQVARLTEALVQAGLLALADRRIVIETACRILDGDAD